MAKLKKAKPKKVKAEVEVVKDEGLESMVVTPEDELAPCPNYPSKLSGAALHFNHKLSVDSLDRDVEYEVKFIVRCRHRGVLHEAGSSDTMAGSEILNLAHGTFTFKQSEL